MMLNKYECYQQQQQQQQQQQHQQQQQQRQRNSSNVTMFHANSNSSLNASNCCSMDAAAFLTTAAIMQRQQTPAASSATMTTSTAALLAASNATPSTNERESIHSGQFMVSHFEAEEAQDDLDDDNDEVKMLDPEDPSLAKPDDEPNPCLEVQLYVPQKVAQSADQFSGGMVTSHLEIETSLSKLFKCMNLAYSQKLTSPKWNHFKGVRLRWKDKIRLNNVIWRCWHMQFVQKRRTPVCQFASPLDVDTHNNPQTVVLEGKYWKRQLTVIKAEYRKWRKNYTTNPVGSSTYDTRSEFDLVEWSPSNERNFMLPEDWASDALFSAINSPFPFPDPREIARTGGIADFIQPSLGPLQPNLEDIDISFEDFMQGQRLETVPEESSDDMLKSDTLYGFPAIMGNDQMDATNIMEVQTTVPGVTVVATTAGGRNTSVTVDEAMLDLNTPGVAFADISQEFVDINSSGVAVVGNVSIMSANSNNQRLGGTRAVLVGQNTNSSATNNANVFTLNTDVDMSGTATSTAGINSRLQAKHFNDNNSIGGLLAGRQNEFPGKSVINGRISKTTQRPFRREPHNYDKAQPTLHQTTVYQQILADQQKSQQQQQQQQTNLLQQQQRLIYNAQTTAQAQQYASQANQVGNFVTAIGFSNDNFAGNLLNLNATPAQQQQMMNVKVEPSHAQEMLTIFNTAQPQPVTSNETFGSANSNAYKPYPNVAQLKKCTTGTTTNYLNVSNAASSAAQKQQQQQQQQTFLQEQNAQQQQLLEVVAAAAAATQAQLFSQGQALPMGLSSSQQQLLQLQQQLNLAAAATTTTATNVQQQQQQQLQLQQQTAAAMGAASGMQKEIHRSNSLPLNATLNKLEQFAMPKYHGKGASGGSSSSRGSRVRSNSVHQHGFSTNNNAVGLQQQQVQLQQQGGSLGNLLLAQQLQTATSEPMLTSTLAQLLTTNSRTINLGTQSNAGNVATAITTPTVANTATTSNVVINTQNTPTTQNLYGAATKGAVPKKLPTTDGGEQLLRQIQQQQQQTSPKKSVSLPTTLVKPKPPGSLSLNHPSQAKTLSYPLAANQMKLSPDMFGEAEAPPDSPTHGGLKFPRETQQRRAGHIHAEQKRRFNIKHGFDTLNTIIPQLQQNPNSKLSKAAMLQKAADYIKQLRTERNKTKDKMETLRLERDALNNSLSHLQSVLPANGAPVTRQGTEHIRQLYDQYVRYGTMNNFKFWILGLILEPLFTSYTNTVSSASLEELRRTSFLWVDQHCSLIDLRPAVSNKLKYLSMNTDILSDPPSTLQDEVAKAINNAAGQHPNLHGS